MSASVVCVVPWQASRLQTYLMVCLYRHMCCLLSAFTHPHNAGVAFHHTLQSCCRPHVPISMHMPQLAASAAVLLTFVGLSKAAAAAAWPEMLDVCPWLHAYKALVHAAGFHQMLDGLDFVGVQYSLVDSTVEASR